MGNNLTGLAHENFSTSPLGMTHEVCYKYSRWEPMGTHEQPRRMLKLLCGRGLGTWVHPSAGMFVGVFEHPWAWVPAGSRARGHLEIFPE